MKRIVLIPAYQPDDTLNETLRSLSGEHLMLLVVDDGSGEAYREVFETAKQYARVVTYDKNRGKGAALKSGLAYIKDHVAVPYAVVTADADGQHTARDILRVLERTEEDPDALVLGSRKIPADAPFRSRLGNAVTRGVFHLMTGTSVQDTQTGLRGFTDRSTEWMLKIEGERYEYEMNVLLAWVREKRRVREVPIKAVYIGGNRSSHFRTVKDSVRIYKNIFLFSGSSLLSFVLDYLLFTVFYGIMGWFALPFALAASNVLARVISASFNYFMNRNVVFKSRAKTSYSAVRYALLACGILLANTVLLKALTGVGIAVWLAKVLTEATLYFASYVIQYRCVFYEKADSTAKALTDECTETPAAQAENAAPESAAEKAAEKTEERIGKRVRRYPCYLAGGLCSAAVLALTVYLALDTFVISTVYGTEAVSAETGTAFENALSNMETDSGTVISAADGGSETAITAAGEDPSDGGDADSAGDRGNRSSGKKKNTSGSSMRSAASSKSSRGANKASRKNASGDSSETEAGSENTEKDTAAAEENSKAQEDGTAAEEEVSAASASSSYETYQDENISISVTEYTVNGSQVYVADVELASAEYFKTAFAEGTYGKNVTAKTSETAKENGAVLAINGDYYGAQEKGYVIRNGIVYRSTSNGDTDVMCIYADGTMQIRNTGEVTAEELAKEGVWQCFSFGPALIEAGEISVTEDTEVGRAMADNPRTAVGILSNNHFLFVVSDGRTDESEGLTLYELAEFLESLGAETAYNLDGGGSSTMYYLGQVINNPTSTGKIKERSVSDIVYIG